MFLSIEKCTQHTDNDKYIKFSEIDTEHKENNVYLDCKQMGKLIRVDDFEGKIHEFVHRCHISA